MSGCKEGPQKTWLFPSGDVCYIGLLRQYQNSTQVATHARESRNAMDCLAAATANADCYALGFAALEFALARPSLMD